MDRSSKGRRLLIGSSWVLLGQVIGVLAQFVYAGFASRQVEPKNFGSYAVALSVVALVLLVFNGGIGSAAARMRDVDDQVLRGLFSYSLLLGLLGAIVTFAAANPWSKIWHAPDAAELIRWSSLIVLLTPSSNLLVGVLQREGRFKHGSIARTTASVVSMAVGCVFVSAYRNGISLLVTNISILIFQFILFSIARRKIIVPGWIRRNSFEDLRFGRKVTGLSVLGYMTANLPILALSRGLGSEFVGNWNRATTVSQVPIELLQQSVLFATYSEFRNDSHHADRARRVWPDVLTLTFWLASLVAVGGFIILPAVVPVILGDGWSNALKFAPWIALTSCSALPVVMLGSALEASGRFRGVLAARISAFVLGVVGAVATTITQRGFVVIATAVVANFCQHVIQLMNAHKLGLLEIRGTLRRYFQPFALAGTVLLCNFVVRRFILDDPHLSDAWRLVESAGVFGAFLVALWTCRRRLEPWRIAAKYGLFARTAD